MVQMPRVYINLKCTDLVSGTLHILIYLILKRTLWDRCYFSFHLSYKANESPREKYLAQPRSHSW